MATGCGIGVLADGGAIEPGNDAMRELLGRLESGDVYRWTLSATDRTALDECLREGGQCRVSVPGIGGESRRIACGVVCYVGQVIISMHDVTAAEAAHVRNRRLTRQRLLGAVMTGLTHDLNNMLGHVLSVTEQMAPLIPDADERQFFERMSGSTVRGAALLRRINSVLSGPGSNAVTDPAGLVRELGAVVQKGIGKHGLTMTIEPIPELPGVSVREDVLFDAALAVLAFARATAAPGDRLGLGCELVGEADDARVAVRIRDRGDPEAGELLAAAVRDPATGILAAGPPGVDFDGLTLALVDLGGDGGDFSVDLTDGREFCLWLPVERDRAEGYRPSR